MMERSPGPSVPDLKFHFKHNKKQNAARHNFSAAPTHTCNTCNMWPVNMWNALRDADDPLSKCRGLLASGRSVAGSHGKAHGVGSDAAVLHTLAGAKVADPAMEEELFHLFVGAGANVNALLVTSYGSQRSALLGAVQHARPTLVRLLLAAGADVNALLLSDTTCVDALAEASINIVESRRAGTLQQRIAIVHMLLSAGARVRPMEMTPYVTRSALAYALDGTIDALEAAIERDRTAGLLAPDANLHCNPVCLHVAVNQNQTVVCMRLLDEGANVAITTYGATMMRYASSVPMVHLLLGACASSADVPWQLRTAAFTAEAWTAIADGGWRRRLSAVRWWFHIHAA